VTPRPADEPTGNGFAAWEATVKEMGMMAERVISRTDGLNETQKLLKSCETWDQNKIRRRRILEDQSHVQLY
jgi:hypothetical protein